MNTKRAITRLADWIESGMYRCEITFLNFLTRIGLIYHHIDYSTQLEDIGTPSLLPAISNDRYEFEVSYLTRLEHFKFQDWYETKGGKKILTIQNRVDTQTRLSFRAELRRFLIQLSPFVKHVATYHSPYFALQVTDDLQQREDHYCDFSKCRYGFELLTIDENPVSVGYQLLTSYLTEKVEEINEVLSGVEHDGAITSSKGQPLVDNLVCRVCGLPVFASPRDGYYFECVHHGEINEVVRVPNPRYQELVRDTLHLLTDR